MDALYVRVSSDCQTNQNQFDDLLLVAEKETAGRDWQYIRHLLAEIVCQGEPGSSAEHNCTVSRAREAVAALITHGIYVEPLRSGKAGARRRPLWEQMKRDAAQGKFDRLLMWKVSRLGRDMREVIATVHDLTDLGVSVLPIKSQTGTIGPDMGKILGLILAWYAEREHGERSEAIRAGQARSRALGRRIGRPRAVFPRDLVVDLRRRGLSWRHIARRLGVGLGTARRAYQLAKAELKAHHNFGAFPDSSHSAAQRTRQQADDSVVPVGNETSG
jgi:putative DNA-invertase from lambdoid prophage Rac